MGKPIMIQGTLSGAGKSIVTTGLCRVFKEAGYKVAPFKAQNISLNSYVTADGLEMGRAQVVQSEACGLAADVRMNPILLKPTGMKGVQVVAFGKVVGNMTINEYGAYKEKIRPRVKETYESLLAENDIVVIEGAGSPAEINLGFENDLVNMGMAKMAKAPILLVGDIDRGGVYAALYGTVMLFDEPERSYFKGLIINKMRGKLSVLDKGNDRLSALLKLPMVGVLPYLEMDIEDEDSVSDRFKGSTQMGQINIGVLKFPSLSNFTDLAVLERMKNVAVHYVDSLKQWSGFDFIILPGSKNTIRDLKWLKERGLDKAILKDAHHGIPVLGICGGYQMLSEKVTDPFGVEEGGSEKGLGCLRGETVLGEEKVLKQVSGNINKVSGVFSSLHNLPFVGYEVHMGETTKGAYPLVSQHNCYGTYIHGILDSKAVVDEVIRILMEKNGFEAVEKSVDINDYKEEQYASLSMNIRQYLDMDLVYAILEKGI